ncbi:MAG: NAD-dependent epimerase/dehydratase family protein, partial [Acidimicrobiaceae bacterium]
MTKNVLLTGGFGTLGGRLAAILAQDTEVNLRLASRVKRNAPQWAPRAETFAVDVENRNSIQEMLNGITHVVHLVAMADFESRAEPEKAQRVNTEYTHRVIERCSKETRFVYLSTIQVYGADLNGTITETTATKPADAYSQTHLDSEKLVESAHKQGQIEGISLRNANGFGAPMSADAKIWQIIANDLCRQAVEKKKLTLKSHGQQYRNFIPFTDVCNAIKHCLFMSSNKIDSTTFNLGSDHTIKVLDLAHLIASRCSTTLGYTPEIQTRTNPPERLPAKFNYDSSKLRATG